MDNINKSAILRRAILIASHCFFTEIAVVWFFFIGKCLLVLGPEETSPQSNIDNWIVKTQNFDHWNKHLSSSLSLRRIKVSINVSLNVTKFWKFWEIRQSVWLLLGVCCCYGCCCPNGPEYKVSDLVFKWSAFNLSLKRSMILIRSM